MSLSNASENQALKMFLQGTDPAYRAGATQYAALVSLAAPDEAAPIAAELTYTGYARVPIASQTKALAPAIGSPIDAAFLPLLPDKAEAAIGAKRKANNDALLAILMEL